MEYDAFLSYSHTDGRIAHALQSGIQRLAKPWFRRPIIRIFRDQTSLSANPGLWSEIERNLSQSKYFILLASPAAARSKWVEREVEWWTAHRPIQHLLIVTTDGTIRWDAAANDFDWPATTCLPQALAGRLTEEPLYVDLSWTKGKDDLSLRHSQFRGAVLDLAAPLHGKPKDELDSEDIRQNRRLRTVTWSGVATIVALAIGAMMAAWFAVQNANEAVRNAITATSRQHAVEAQLLLRQGRLGDAMVSALKAFRTEDTTDARSALFQTLEATWDIHAVLRGHQGPVWAVGFRPLRQELVSWSADNTLLVWDLRNRRPLSVTRLGAAVDVRAAALSPDAHILAAGLPDGSIQLWDTESVRTLAGLKGSNGSEVLSLAFDSHATLLAAGHQDGEIVLWDVARSAPASTHLARPDHPPFDRTALSISSDGRYLAATNGSYSAPVDVWALPAGTFVAAVRRSGKFSMNERVAFATDDDADRAVHLVIGTSEGVVEVFREVTGSPERFQRASGADKHQGAVSVLASAAGRLASGGGDGLVSISGYFNEAPVSPASWSKSRVQSLAFLGAGEYLAAGATDGTVTVYYGGLGRPRSLDGVAALSSARRSPGGRWIVRNLDEPRTLPHKFSIVDAVSQQVVLGGFQGNVVFSGDDRWMAVTMADSTALWDLSGEPPSRQPVLTRRARRTSFSASGHLLVTEVRAHDGDVRVFDLMKSPPGEQTVQQGPEGLFRGFSADEQLLITTEGLVAHLWDRKSGGRVGPSVALEPLMGVADDDTYRLEISADHRWLLAGRTRGALSLHRIGASGTPPFPAGCFPFGWLSGDWKWAATTSGEGDCLVSLETATPLFHAQRKAEPFGDLPLWRFTADSRWAIRFGRDGARAWNLQRPSAPPSVLNVRAVGNVEVSPDGRWAVVREVVGNDLAPRLWNLAGPTPEEKTLPTDTTQVLFTPDGLRLLTFGKKRTTIWDAPTLAHRDLPVAVDSATAYTVSPDGATLAADDGSGRIVLVDLATGRIVTVLEGHSKPLFDVAYSPDGRVLASTEFNGSLIMWDAIGLRRLSETFAGPGERDDPDYVVRFDAEGMRVNGLPAHPLLWIEELCRSMDPGVSREEWRRLFDATPYPWTCDQIKGVTPRDLVQAPEGRRRP